ncbi:MAG: hypothetical protein E6J43_13655 [Chloroflexi bacterium]|nr:MAG: hypothetical protein E6J43_13655 [Chloroflexota bacterium]
MVSRFAAFVVVVGLVLTARRISNVALASAIVLIVGVATAFDPGHGVTYENQTDSRVTVYRIGIVDTTLEPGQSKTFSFNEIKGEQTIEAKDDNGRTLYVDTVTWDDLKQRGWTIVIKQSGAPTQVPSPSPLR